MCVVYDQFDHIIPEVGDDQSVCDIAANDLLVQIVELVHMVLTHYSDIRELYRHFFVKVTSAIITCLVS